MKSNKKKRNSNKYDGCLYDSYGYGGITDCNKYLVDKYGTTPELVEWKNVPMEPFKMSVFETGMPNCVLTAMTRIFQYYRNIGLHTIDENRADIYKKVREVSSANKYTPKKGLGFSKITHVFKVIAKQYQLQEIKVRGYYLFGLFHGIKKEIDAQRPVLFNISFGYYENHTVTVCGYYIYQIQRHFGPIKYNQLRRFVAVHDGWNENIMYIDYHRFHVPASINKIIINNDK